MIRVVRNLLLLGALALLVLPAGAQASPLTDCRRDGDLDKSYSSSELNKALDNLPTDLDEYSDCRSVLNGAIHSGSDKGGGRPGSPDNSGTGGSDGGAGGAGGGAGAISAEEQTARDNDAKDLQAITGDAEGNRPSVDVGGKTVEPGSNGLFDLASSSNDLPGPLLVALIALGVLAIVGGIVALRGRVPLLARIPLLSKIPTPRVSLPRFRR